MYTLKHWYTTVSTLDDFHPLLLERVEIICYTYSRNDIHTDHIHSNHLQALLLQLCAPKNEIVNTCIVQSFVMKALIPAVELLSEHNIMSNIMPAHPPSATPPAQVSPPPWPAHPPSATPPAQVSPPNNPLPDAAKGPILLSAPTSTGLVAGPIPPQSAPKLSCIIC